MKCSKVVLEQALYVGKMRALMYRTCSRDSSTRLLPRRSTFLRKDAFPSKLFMLLRSLSGWSHHVMVPIGQDGDLSQLRTAACNARACLKLQLYPQMNLTEGCEEEDGMPASGKATSA